MSTEEKRASIRGGLTVSWLLAEDVRSFESKRDGKPRTVIALRDPSNLNNSMVVFLDGEAGALATARQGSLVTLHVDEVRSGQGRGELIARASRSDVEAALGVRGGTS